MHRPPRRPGLDFGRPVVIVSHNAEPAIEAFLDHHDLRHLVHAVIGRVPGRPELMKPHPTPCSVPSTSPTDRPRNASSSVTP
ncbi:MAG TPA: hypothetical protein VJ301_00955 [Propionibacteriaceae bacterium]|nr:hypothetical protein [Propionibacteriaceae bacterium]